MAFVGSRAHVDNMSSYEAYGHFMVESGVIENVWLGYERRGKEDRGSRGIGAYDWRWSVDGILTLERPAQHSISRLRSIISATCAQRTQWRPSVRSREREDPQYGPLRTVVGWRWVK
jgi:hypothetical protein